MKIGITCGGIGPYAGKDFLRWSIQAAEKAGFAHYWLPEHVVQFAEYPRSRYPYADGSGQELPEQSADAPLQFGDDTYAMTDPRNAFADPVVAMTWLAAASTVIEIGTNVMVLPQRNPVVLAKELATLDLFADGRIVLGAGVGWALEEFEAIGVDFARRGKLADEAIDVMRSLWRDGPADFAGAFHSFASCYSYPKPTRPGGIPILIGGESKAALRRVAQRGDGWLPYNLPVGEAAATIAGLKAMTAEAGRDPEALRIVKIVYRTATIDDLKRYRDAGVTEFNLASSGDLPLDEAGIHAKMDEIGDAIVGPVLEL